MEESEISSCSSLKECNESAVCPPSKDSPNMQSIALQNEHLQEVNEQLQTTLDTLRAQLKDALDAASVAKTFTDQIQNLKNQVNEANHKRDSLARELKQLQATHESEVNKLNEQIKKMQTNTTDSTSKNKNYESHINRLRKERNQLKDIVAEKEQILELVDHEIQKAKGSRKKLQQNTKKVAEQLVTAEQKIEELTLALQKSESEKTKLSQSVESLTLQLSTANAFNDEAKNNSEVQKNELAIKDKMIESLEKQLEAQRTELEDFNAERPTFIALVQKSHKALTASELTIDRLNDEIADLKMRLKGAPSTASKITALLSQANLLDLHIPFEGEIADRCEEILKLPQYQPLQKIQLLLNEAAKRLAECEKESAEAIRQADITKRKAEDMIKNAKPKVDEEGQFRQIAKALLTELRQYACPGVSDSFEAFVAEKCAQIDPLLSSSQSPDIPAGFFSLASVDERMKAASTLVKEGTPAGSLFQAQFLLNSLLRQKVNDLSHSQLDITNAQLAEQAAKHNDTVRNLNEQIEKLKESRKQIHQQLKQSQQSTTDNSRVENEFKTRINQLQLQLESAQHENEVLQVKLQVCQNELLLKTKEAQTMLQSQSIVLPDEDRLEQQLRAKTEECEEMAAMLKKLQAALEESSKKQAKKARAADEAHKREVAELQEQILAQEEELTRLRKKAKKQIKTMKEQFAASMDELNSNYEKSKATFEDTVKALTEKADEARTLSQQLVKSLTACEQKNQKVQSENQQLLQAQKELQLQNTMARQQLAKEKQNIQAQLAAATLGCESKVQEAMVQTKAQYEKRLTSLLNLASQTIGAFYGVDEGSFTEESFAQLVTHAKSDLQKLKYFQNETTKYLPNE